MLFISHTHRLNLSQDVAGRDLVTHRLAPLGQCALFVHSVRTPTEDLSEQSVSFGYGIAVASTHLAHCRRQARHRHHLVRRHWREHGSRAPVRACFLTRRCVRQVGNTPRACCRYSRHGPACFAARIEGHARLPAAEKGRAVNRRWADGCGHAALRELQCASQCTISDKLKQLARGQQHRAWSDGTIQLWKLCPHASSICGSSAYVNSLTWVPAAAVLTP